jgi:hypothetical protein
VARGAHRNGRGDRRAVWILASILILGAVAAGAWFLFFRPGAPIPIDLGEPDRPEFTFELIRVKGDSPNGRVDGDSLQEEAEAVRETLDALYAAGYIDPEKWKNGRFPEALDQFAPSARRQARRDIDQFTLGSDAKEIDAITPINGRLEVEFLEDGKQTAIGAVAETIFAANGTLKAGGPMAVQHDGTYYLRPDGDRWLIIGYDVRGTVTAVAEPLPADGEATP